MDSGGGTACDAPSRLHLGVIMGWEAAILATLSDGPQWRCYPRRNVKEQKGSEDSTTRFPTGLVTGQRFDPQPCPSASLPY